MMWGIASDGLIPMSLSTPWAIRALELLFALSAGIQTLEYLRMRKAMHNAGLWSWTIQRRDIPHRAIRSGFDFLFSEPIFRGLLWARLIALMSLGWRACFWYITIQSITSYFVSGAIKLLQAEWRDGSAMTIFLNAAIHGPLNQQHWLRQPWLSAIGCWTFILWECAAPLALLQTSLAVAYCLIAALFHFLVFWFFGLNRFFWAWVASFPAIIWCAGQLL